MKFLIILVLFLIASLVVGNAIASFFSRHKGEPYYFWRTYRLYQIGHIDLGTFILVSCLNGFYGAFIVGVTFVFLYF